MRPGRCRRGASTSFSLRTAAHCRPGRWPNAYAAGLRLIQAWNQSQMGEQLGIGETSTLNGPIQMDGATGTPPVITNQPADLRVSCGQQVAFTVVVSNDSPSVSYS